MGRSLGRLAAALFGCYVSLFVLSCDHHQVSSSSLSVVPRGKPDVNALDGRTVRAEVAPLEWKRAPDSQVVEVAERSKRAVNPKKPRVMQAQKSKNATTTTTTTTTTTSTTSTTTASSTTADAGSEEGGEDAAAADESGVEYEGPESAATPAAEEPPAADEGSQETDNEFVKPPERKQSGAAGNRPASAATNTRAGKPGKAAAATTGSGYKALAFGNQSDSDAAAAAEGNPMSEEWEPRKFRKKKPLLAVPFIRGKNESVCTPEAYLEFPRDPIGNKWRHRGLVLVHIAIVCYMFYSLALVCERYFMPSLEEFAQRLNLSEDVAGATLMSAGSSAPELFTAILGVFVAKGDVGTGAIVGSAVFNILFVIGICSFVSTTCAQLNWWPVLRDSVFYTFTVLVLIMFIYDERITALESFLMLCLYGLYILLMANNDKAKALVTSTLLQHPLTAKLINGSHQQSMDGPDEVFGSSSSEAGLYKSTSFGGGGGGVVRKVEEDSMYLAACLVIAKHKRLFRPLLRFQAAAWYIITKRQHRNQSRYKPGGSVKKAQMAAPVGGSNEVDYFGPENESLAHSSSQIGTGQRNRMDAYARTTSKNKFSMLSKDDYEFWNRPPEEGENYYLWLAKIPVNYVLHYTVPDCTLYPDKYLITFFVSIVWTAIFSYIMVWMVTLIGYTFGIPDSVMGVTFLAAGTSVPDCYSSIHAARNGMADMAVSNSIGSNVFDILVGLSLPWFIQTAIYPGVVATINSRGVIYSVILLFLSLVVTIYLMNKYEWTLKPRLGLALLVAYGLFIVLTSMLEFNLFGHVNPPPCPVV